MMLQTLTLCINDSKVPHARKRWFLYYTGHVVAIFTSMLRDRFSYALDGSRDVHIFLGPRGENPTYSQIAVKPPLGKYSVSHCFVEDFNVGEFLDASQEERDRLTLAILEATVMDIARKVGADPEPIRLAAEATRQSGFEACLPAPRFYPWEKHAPQQTTASGHMAALVCKVGLGTQTWGVEVRDAAGAAVALVWIPPKKYQYLAAGQVFRRAKCKGDVFWLEDEHGQISFKLDVGRVVGKTGMLEPAPRKKTTPQTAARKRRARREGKKDR